jgi:hypothetical protein
MTEQEGLSMKSWWMTLALVFSVAVSTVGAGTFGPRSGEGEHSVDGTAPMNESGDQGGEGPGECWDVYVEEAIEAYLEYEECMASEQWWDLAGQAGCALVYDMRAIGAFSWWVTCVGFRS